MLRHMLAVGPYPWRELGLRADEWPDCIVTESEGGADAARLLRRSAFDVILTSPRSPASRDLAIIHEAREQQPGIRAVMLASALAPDDIIQAMRTEVFACFATPVSSDELRSAIISALDADQWKNGIEVVSASPHWITLKVACRRVTADRLTMFINELARGIPKLDREDLSTAFREVLLNAMEHGAGFDESKVIEVAAVRTERAIVYYFKDQVRDSIPGPPVW